jgi:hypothetical protein
MRLSTFAVYAVAARTILNPNYELIAPAACSTSRSRTDDDPPPTDPTPTKPTGSVVPFRQRRKVKSMNDPFS